MSYSAFEQYPKISIKIFNDIYGEGFFLQCIIYHYIPQACGLRTFNVKTNIKLFHCISHCKVYNIFFKVISTMKYLGYVNATKIIPLFRSLIRVTLVPKKTELLTGRPSLQVADLQFEQGIGTDLQIVQGLLVNLSVSNPSALNRRFTRSALS